MKIYFFILVTHKNNQAMDYYLIPKFQVVRFVAVIFEHIILTLYYLKHDENYSNDSDSCGDDFRECAPHLKLLKV